MELHILHLHRLTPCRSSRALEHCFVVEPKAKFWHTRQVTLHLYSTEDFTPQDAAGRRDEKVEGFDYVEKDFVFAIADALAAPGDCVGDGDWGAGLDFELVGLLGYVSIAPVSAHRWKWCE